MTTTVLSPQERLLDVASRLFYAEGIHAVGIERVIAEASVAKATLYAHFASKADLVAAYLERESLAWIDEAERRIEGLASGADALRALFEMLYERSRAAGYRGCPFVNAAAEFPNPGPVVEQIAAHRARQRATISSAVEPASTTPEMVDAIFALFVGSMSAAYLDQRPSIILHASAAATRFLDCGD